MNSDNQSRAIVLNATGWAGAEDFYTNFLTQVGAPEWHGHNLDALEESIRDSDINEINVPYSIVLTGTSRATPEFQQWLVGLRELVDDLIRNGVPIQLAVSD